MRTDEAYSILDIVGAEEGLVLSKAGNVTVSFLLAEPECYSLHTTDIDERCALYREAFRFLPEDSYVHKQDIFLKRQYRADSFSETFLSKADARHFSGRLYLEHTCVLHFTLSRLESLEKSYVSSPLKYREDLHRRDQKKLEGFLEAVENALSIIKNIRDTSITRMTAESLKEFVGAYTNLFADGNSVRDMHFDSEMKVGSDTVKYFCICDEGFLPENNLPSFLKDQSLPQANSELYHAPLETLGVYLPYNHIVNQVIFFEGHERLKELVSQNLDIYGSNSSMNDSVKTDFARLKELHKEILEENDLFVRSYTSVCIFDSDPEEVEKAEKKIRESLNMAQFKYYIPSYENLAAVHLSSVPGQITCLPRGFLFLTTLPVALAMFLHYTAFKNDGEGINVHDRLFQVPLKKDIWDAAKKRVYARNGMVIAGTGGGKSAFALNFTQQLVEQGYTVIVVEFGKSFSQLCKLYPDVSLHVDYDGQTPLGINPFDLQGRELENDDLVMLSNIVQRYWKHMYGKDESEQEVALTRFIQDYYDHPREERNFMDFYRYVDQNYEEMIGRMEIPKKYFKIESFRLNCGEFMPGRRYENVCRDTHVDFSSKKFIVFELTQIKHDRFLSNLVMSMTFSVIQKKLLSNRSKRGILIFDEYAETAQMKDTATNTGIHSSVAFCYQKIRKENGAVYTIVQTPDQLPDDENTKNIISNTDFLFVLPTKEVIYRSIIDKFKITREAQINLMKSMRNNFSSERPYSECFMRMGENYATVTRLEFSREKFLAFQTDGEVWSVLEEKTRRLGMEEAIREYMAEHPTKRQ